MRDGCVLRADVYRPRDADGPLPVLLLRTPYDRRYPAQSFAHAADLAREGFVVALQDVRGRFGSDGEFRPFATEAQDGADSIAWAAELPGADGRVVTFGASYCGRVQLLAAAQRPPALHGMCCLVPGGRLAQGWHSSGGANQLGFLTTWGAALGVDEARRSGDQEAANHFTAVLAQPAAVLGDPALLREGPFARHVPWLTAWLDGDVEDPLEDPDWAEAVEVPALLVSGWYDIFHQGTLETGRRLTSAGRDVRLLLGPWTHGPFAPLVRRLWVPAAGGEEVDGAVVAAARRMVGDRRLTPGARHYELLADRWHETAGWPAGGERLTLHLDSPGRAQGTVAGGRLIVGTSGGPPDFLIGEPTAVPSPPAAHGLWEEHWGPVGPVDVAEFEAQPEVLVYRSAPLERDLIIAGPVELVIFRSADVPSADVAARLVAATGEGRLLLADALLRAAAGTEPAELRLRLADLRVRLRAGTAVHLHLTAGSMPMWEPNPQTGGLPRSRGGVLGDHPIGTQLVLHDAAYPSRVEFTVLPAPGPA